MTTEHDTTDETRVCPSCDEERPATAFRSSHPRTHCDECHAAKSGSAVQTSAPAEDEASTEPTNGADEPEADEDPVEEARLARLIAARIDCDRCPVLGIALDLTTDTGHDTPARFRGTWMSAMAASMLRAGLSPEALEQAAEWIRDREVPTEEGA